MLMRDSQDFSPLHTSEISAIITSRDALPMQKVKNTGAAQLFRPQPYLGISPSSDDFLAGNTPAGQRFRRRRAESLIPAIYYKRLRPERSPPRLFSLLSSIA